MAEVRNSGKLAKTTPRKVPIRKGARHAKPAPGFFHAYDVRGRFPSEIDASAALELGRAVARAFPGPAVLGRDTRAESVPFSRLLVRGLTAEGSPVTRIGIVPTPVVAFAAANWRMLGLSATPSHNAVGYVGLKGFDSRGRILGSAWAKVRAQFGVSRGRPRAPAGRGPKGGRPPTRRNVERAYLERITEGIRFSGTVVVDPRGGAASSLAVRAMRRIGASVVPIDAVFSPNFFGRSAEPRPEDLVGLAAAVRQKGALFGATYDGDADRVLFVDGSGRFVEPELIALLFHRALGRTSRSLVATVDASRRLERFAPVVRSRVGTRYVIEAMRRSRSQVGVEASSHIYLGRDYESSDGIRVSVELARVLASDPEALDRIREEVGPIVRAQGTITYASFPEAERAYDALRATAPGGAASSMDGFLLKTPDGLCLVRRSNTQPSVRFALEAESKRGLESSARFVSEWVGRMAASARPSGPLEFH